MAKIIETLYSKRGTKVLIKEVCPGHFEITTEQQEQSWNLVFRTKEEALKKAKKMIDSWK